MMRTMLRTMVRMIVGTALGTAMGTALGTAMGTARGTVVVTMAQSPDAHRAIEMQRIWPYISEHPRVSWLYPIKEVLR